MRGKPQVLISYILIDNKYVKGVSKGRQVVTQKTERVNHIMLFMCDKRDRI